MDGFNEDDEDDSRKKRYDQSIYGPMPINAPSDVVPAPAPVPMNQPTTLPLSNFYSPVLLNEPLLDDHFFGLGLWQDDQVPSLTDALWLEPAVEPLGLSAASETQQYLPANVPAEWSEFQSDIYQENTIGQLDMFHHTLHGNNREPYLTLPLLPSPGHLPSYGHSLTREMSSSTADMLRSGTLSSRTLEHSLPPDFPTPQTRHMSAAPVTLGEAIQSPLQSSASGPGSTSMVRKRLHSPESEQSLGPTLPNQPQGMFLTLGKRNHTRRKLNKKEREHTTFVRDRGGSCPRCRRLKLKCWLADNPYEPCKGCKEQKKSYRIPIMPCFQSKIIELLFFRSRPFFNSPLEQKRETLFDLADFTEQGSTVHTVNLTQDHGEEIEVYVSRFIRAEGDKIAYEWKTDQGRRRLELPPYCLTNVDGIRRNLQQYVKKTRDTYLAELSECNPIISLTIDMAVNHTKFRPETMLSRALELWAASRIIEKVWRISGEETLGIRIADDPTFPRFNTIPITPIMDTQMDQIVIQHILEPLRIQILEELNKKVAEHKRETFFEIYLTVFVLLCNIERTTINEASFARRYGIGVRFPNLKLLESYFHSARTLLSHFHFVCRGFAAIQSDWSKPAVVEFARLDREQQEFMSQIKDQVNKQENELRLIRREDKYDNLLYWSHQLFFAGWNHGGPIQIQNDLEERPL